jgi:hypothetical protein
MLHRTGKLFCVLAVLYIALGIGADVNAQDIKAPSRYLVSEYESCVTDNVNDLDDQFSEAMTIANAINIVCRPKLKALIKSAIPDTDAEIAAFRKMQILIPHYEEKVLPKVLQRRSAMKRRQS